MPRKPLAIAPLDRKAASSLQNQLAVGLKQLIEAGLLKPGEQLPSSRQLARDLRVSRNTVVAACDRLLGEGYLESDVRSGVGVSRDFEPQVHPPGKSRSAARPEATLAAPTARLDGPRPFRPCQPEVRLFPLAHWNRLRNQALRRLGHGLLHYQSRHALGLPSLRRELAGYLNASRGVRCDWRRIAITSGSQQALFLLGRLLLEHRDRVYMEDPGYRGAQRAFLAAGAKLEGLSVDADGAVPPAKCKPARIVYCTPSRQFPTGATMPVARRMKLLDFARRCGAWLVEDDYDSEFRYAGPPLPSLQGLDGTQRVIHIGSMSKTLVPSLRIGYVVLPEELMEPFEAQRLVIDDHGPLIDQAALAAFIATGGFYSHIRKCRKAYAQKLECFLEAMRLNDAPLEFPFADGGMNQTGYLSDPGLKAATCSAGLARAGLDVPATKGFLMKPATTIPEALVFGFSAFDPAEIRRGVAQVAVVLRAGRGSGQRRRKRPRSAESCGAND